MAKKDRTQLGEIWDPDAGWLHKKVECEPQFFYVKNPLNIAPQKLEEGHPAREFIEQRIRPMPIGKENYLLWKFRCDYIWDDFRAMCDSPINQETLWGYLRVWIPDISCERRVFYCKKVTEGAEGKVLWYWYEHTFEIERVGYNGLPESVW